MDSEFCFFTAHESFYMCKISGIKATNFVPACRIVPNLFFFNPTISKEMIV